MGLMEDAAGKNVKPGGWKPPKLPYVHSDAREQASVSNARSNSFRGSKNARDLNAEKAYWNQFTTLPGSQPTTTPGGGGRRGGYGGGGGGGISKAEQQAAAQSQIDMLMKLAGSSAFRSPKRQFERDYSGRDDILGALEADRTAQGQGFDELDQYIAGLGNTYRAAPEARGTDMAVDDLSALLGAQGGSDAGLRAEAQYQQGVSQQGADAANRQRQSMIDMQDQWNRSLGTESQLARRFEEGELSAQGRGLTAADNRRQSDRKDKIDEQNFQGAQGDRQALLQLIAQISQLSAGSGLKTPGIDIEALLKGLG